MSVLQANSLAMLGLGNATTAGLDLGIHLRWHFSASLNWPTYGFDIFRRQAASALLTCIDFPSVVFADPRRMRASYDGGATPGKLTIISTAPLRVTTGPYALATSRRATLVFACSEKMRQFTVNVLCTSGSISLKAYDGAMDVSSASAHANGTAVTLAVKADRFDRVVLTAPTAANLYQVCWAVVTDSSDWTKLVSLNLPPDQPTADRRLPASLSAPVRARYNSGWPRLTAVIGKIWSGLTSQVINAVSGTAGSPALDVNFIHLLQAASLDPNIARIVGLYFVDATAAIGSVYDYKVTGNWSAIGSAEYAWICFGLSRGTPAAVPRPSGLTRTQVTVPGGIAAGSRKSQSAVALGWTIPRSTGGQLHLTAPVLYNVYRDDRKPDGTWMATKTLTNGRPIVAKAASSNPRYYTDGPVALGAYRYKIAGVDIFGRSSAYSTRVGITVTDDAPPPPPIGLTALLADVEDTPPVDVNVSWTWTSDQREQAADASQFRVYHQYEDLYPADGTVTAVASGSVADTTNLTTDLDVSGDYSRFTDGYLHCRGARYRVTGIAVSGGSVVVTVENSKDGTAPAAATPDGLRSYLVFLTDAWKMKGRFLLRTDWSNRSHWQSAYSTKTVTSASDYSTTIRNIPVTVDASTPTATIMIAVCTEDVNGNIGPLSTPVSVQVRNNVAPSAPSLSVTDAEYASKADYYGNSRYTIQFRSPASGTRYEIFRSTDTALRAAAGSSQELSDITDTALLAWADDEYTETLLTYRSAFMNVATTDQTEHEDSFPGTINNRYVYKVRSIDSAGNRGSFADGFVVHLHDVFPPATPVWKTVVGGDREITLTWAKNQETDLAGYRVYRSDTAEGAEDIRSMTLVDEVPAGTETCTDTVEPLTNYWYRLTAIDTSDNESMPSPARVTRAADNTPPSPPAFTVSEWNDSSGALAVQLEWDAVASGVEVMIQRRKISQTEFSAISTWIDSGTQSYDDTEAEPYITYVYRLLVKSAAGVLNTDFEEATIVAAYASA
jgi:hypothetical protein